MISAEHERERQSEGPGRDAGDGRRDDGDGDVAEQRRGDRADRLLDHRAPACVGLRRSEPEQPVVIVGRSMSRNSERNVSVTSERNEPKIPPVMPSSVDAASGSPAARFLSALRIVSSAPAVLVIDWNQSFCCSSSEYAGSEWTKSTISDHTGPAVTMTSATTATNRAAKTQSDARPRFQPRLTSAATIGSRPSARIAARKIEISVPSERSASATSAPTTTSTRSVRAPMVTSMRCGGTTGPASRCVSRRSAYGGSSFDDLRATLIRARLAVVIRSGRSMTGAPDHPQRMMSRVGGDGGLPSVAPHGPPAAQLVADGALSIHTVLASREATYE